MINIDTNLQTIDNETIDNKTIPDEKITLDNVKFIIQKKYDDKLMKQYLLRDIKKSELKYVYYEACIKAYYGKKFYDDLFN